MIKAKETQVETEQSQSAHISESTTTKDPSSNMLARVHMRAEIKKKRRRCRSISLHTKKKKKKHTYVHSLHTNVYFDYNSVLSSSSSWVPPKLVSVYKFYLKLPQQKWHRAIFRSRSRYRNLVIILSKAATLGMPLNEFVNLLKSVLAFRDHSINYLLN